jgi:hypothetical protein
MCRLGSFVFLVITAWFAVLVGELYAGAHHSLVLTEPTAVAAVPADDPVEAPQGRAGDLSTEGEESDGEEEPDEDAPDPAPGLPHYAHVPPPAHGFGRLTSSTTYHATSTVVRGLYRPPRA